MKEICPSSDGELNSSRRRKGGRVPLWALLLGDVAMAALILGVFFMFYGMAPEAGAEIQTAKPAPTVAAVKVPAATSVPIAATPAVKAVATPDVSRERGTFTLSEAVREKFSDTLIITDTSYRSPGISVEVSNHQTQVGEDLLCYHVEDIYISGIECFQTRFATGELDFYKGEPVLLLDREASAVVAMNGDYANTQKSGLLIRNGEHLLGGQNILDICVRYKDGSMETYGPGEYTEEELLSEDVWQLWKLGPRLLDEEGRACTVFNTSNIILGKNPRSGLGYYEPGHYCFVVVDGRQSDHSDGLEMQEFAELFEELGCVRAYNMDGGDSSVMTFNDSIYSRPSGGGRSLGDILFICDPDSAEETE